jgi:hypothetical protein
MSNWERIIWILFASFLFNEKSYIYFFILLVILSIQFNWTIISRYLEKLDERCHTIHSIFIKVIKIIILNYQYIKFTVKFILISLLKKWTLLPILIMLLLSLLVYIELKGVTSVTNKIPLFLNEDILKLILKNDNVTDKDLSFIFLIIFRSLWIFGPLSITFYIFTYREQKGSSYSYLTTGWTTKLLLAFLLSSILTVIYSFVISSRLTSYINNFNNNSNPISLLFFHENILQINIILIMFISSIIIGTLVIYLLWKGISLESALKQSVINTRDNISYLSFIFINKEFFSDSRKEIYNKLNHIIETNYQLLMSALDNNTNYLFQKYYDHLEFNLYYLHTSPRIYYILTEPRYMYFIRKDANNYKILYKSILKNQLTLIQELLQKKKVEEADKSVKLFFSMSPGIFSLEKLYNEAKVKQIKDDYKELFAIYFSSLYELTLLLSSSGIIGIDQILNNMNKIEEEEDLVRKKDTIVIYRALMITSVEKNDLRLLTETVNSIINNISKLNKTNNQMKVQTNLTIDGIKLVINNKKLSQISRKYDERIEGISQTQLEELIIYTILEATLKSIELGYYSCTGYLIKLLTTNLDYSLIKSAFSIFAERRGLESHPLINSSLKKAVGKEFNISPVSAEYCLQKLTIILYTQQKYYKKFKEITHNSIDLIDTSLTINTMLRIDYLHKKILNAKDKYGLLCLTEEGLLEKTKLELIRNISESRVNLKALSVDIREEI